MRYNLDYAYNLMEKYSLEVLIATVPQTLKYFEFNPWINYSEEWMFKPGGSNTGAIKNICIIPYKKDPIYILSAELLSFLGFIDIENVYAYGIFYNLESREPCDCHKGINFSNNEIDLKINNVFKKGIFNNFLSALTSVIFENKLSNSIVGIEKTGLDPILFKKIIKKLPKCKFIDSTEIFRILRMIKSSEELKIIKQCAEITEFALKESLKVLKPGSTFGDVIKKFKLNLYKKNANFEHFIYLTRGLGCLSNYDYPIENDSIFGIDVGAIFDDYLSDTAVTIFLGKYNNSDLEIYKMLLDIINTGFDFAKPGVCCKEVYQSMLKIQKKYNLQDCKFEGHGIGLSCREYPVINKEIGYNYFDGLSNKNSNFIIEENSVFNIEISLHCFGDKTFQIEETSIINKIGAERIKCQHRSLPIVI